MLITKIREPLFPPLSIPKGHTYREVEFSSSNPLTSRVEEHFRALAAMEMEVYPRNVNESLLIGDDILVLVTDIAGGKVVLSVQVPKYYLVYTDESNDGVNEHLDQRDSGTQQVLVEASTEPKLDPDVVITIIAINGNGIRLGITAPGETPVHRFEMFELVGGEIDKTNWKEHIFTRGLHEEIKVSY